MDQDYPYLDDTGTLWYDGNGFKGENTGECFICHNPTDRVDINFLTFFCNTPACNSRIATVLARNGYEGDFDTDYAESKREEDGRE